MRYGRVVRAIALLGVLVWAAGCSDGDEEARGSSAPPTVSTPATTGTPSSSSSKPAYYDNDDNVLMAKGDCYGPPRDVEQGHAVEMPCDDPDAIGKVLKRVEKKTTVYTYIDCSDSTDDVLGISGDPGWEVAGSRDYLKYVAGVGYACVRNLKAPHPGEPGQGGMEIRVGDCLEASDTGDKYEEVPCDGEVLPDVKVIGRPDLDNNCPRKDDTQLTEESILNVSGLGGGPVYCARAYAEL
ncbi:hypothetical protein OG418_45650 [Streptomyces phaeochromogenes]|uniref:Lipoprotein n=1 Tax=Streptomyces phaeochromogenes TaxID=1923 RepID=A0ABZ1H4I4_STRPH|nr:hypothetical protein [Streptomyces phaeochromogenes]MCX5602274.1 hypothetical protein [Streptomyces phaeochromogenes]WRZ26946.1 hypothetical protein OG931_03960 [Streptomyces phaeochromogenes]WSD12512.1 hypothetical protein OHB35_04365 [Streptomyces phaeochromogenes]WSJ10693.1 hypothetical protein OG437_47195 [Streptomyces phaeochromogenes]